MTERAHVPMLNNAPLLEAVFEVRWETEISEEQVITDPGYELAQGAFEKEISDVLPHYKRIGSTLGLPQAYRPAHQFWKADRRWPLVQLGPGLMSVNDLGSQYEWEKSFKPLIYQALNVLEHSYKRGVNYNFSQLRYLNIVEVPQGVDFYSHLNEVLQVNIQKAFSMDGNPSDISWGETYYLSDGSKLNFSVASAVKANSQQMGLLWQIAITKEGKTSIDELYTWLGNAYLNTSTVFRKIISQKYYDSFI